MEIRAPWVGFSGELRVSKTMPPFNEEIKKVCFSNTGSGTADLRSTISERSQR